MANWFDKMVNKIRNADSEADIAQIKDEYKGIVDGTTADENGMHIHVHGGGGGVARDEDDPPPQIEDPDNDADLETRLAALEAKVAQLEDLLNNDEGEVELEDSMSKDARRFVMRRGSKIKSRDEDIPVPERQPELIGETDLPGIEDLDKRMVASQDSADQEELWQETMTMAAIIVPTIKVRTFDSRVPMLNTAKRLCSFRRTVMDSAFEDEQTSEIVAEFTGIKTRDELKKVRDCDTVKQAFYTTASAIKRLNNQNITRASVGDASKRSVDGGRATTPSIAEMNKKNAEFWDAKIHPARR